jgi:signal transduction histidine kinase
MDFLDFPIVALGAALICLIGVTIYAITQRTSIRTRDEQLVVARAQAYAMLELSQAGVLFLDRQHKLMGEASAVAPELLGHTCAAGTAFVQVIAELVPIHVRRDTVAYLESLWQAEPTAVVDATQNPLQRVHSGSRHLAIRFSRLVVDGRVHHLIVSIERVSAPRLVPQTIEVPILNEETFARRLAGETGTRPALSLEALRAASPDREPVSPACSTSPASPASPASLAADSGSTAATGPHLAGTLPAIGTGGVDLGSLDVTQDPLPSLALAAAEAVAAQSSTTLRASPGIEHMAEQAPVPSEVVAAATEPPLSPAASEPAANPAASPLIAEPAQPAPAPSAPPPVIDPPDPRLNGALEELLPIDPERLDAFLVEARDKAGQLRAIMKLPARDPQAFREKLVLILELTRGIRARAERLPLASVNERSGRFEAALNALRDKHPLSGNDFLPLAVKLDDLLSHLAIQSEVATRLRDWRAKYGAPPAPSDATQRSVTSTGTTIRQPRILPEEIASTSATTLAAPLSATQKAARLSDLSSESLEEMAAFLSDMYGRRVSLVVVGLEDVPQHYRRPVEKILGQLIHNAIRHGIEAPADRLAQQKPEAGTVSVQFARLGGDGYQLSVQDDGRGLDHDKIRAEAIRQGVLTAEEAANLDARRLASLIFRAGFTTAGEGAARGIGMDVVRDLVSKAGGRVGIATKPGEYTRFRITLPHESKAANAQVA